MSSTAQMMLEIAARLIEEARKLAAPSVDTRTFFGTYNYDPQHWITMVREFQDRDAMQGKTPFDPSLIAGIMGTAGGSRFPKSWDTHGRILDAAQGGELNDGIGWTINDKPFRRWDYLTESTEGKHQVLLDVWNSDKGREWRAHPLNLPVLPKGEPQL